MTFKQSLALAAATIALSTPAWAHNHGSMADDAKKEASDAVNAAVADAEAAVDDVTEAVDETTEAVENTVDGDTETEETTDADVSDEMSDTAEVIEPDTSDENAVVDVESVTEDINAVVAPEAPDAPAASAPTNLTEPAAAPTPDETTSVVETVTDAADAIVPANPTVDVVAPAAVAVTDQVEVSLPETTVVVTDLSNIRNVLASSIRDDDRARDQYRNPMETLSFFGIKPDMTVGEYAPGGGWYTRVLAPYLSTEGEYVAINHDIDRYLADADEERFNKAKAWADNFPGQVNEWTGLSAEGVTAFEADEIPEGMEGSLDAVVIFRSLHGLYNREMADSTIRDFYDVLKPGGIVGVVQHRANEDAPHDYVDGSNGYLKQSEVIALFKSQGFVAAKQADINANPNDPANWEGGVWTLPPVLRYGDENRDEYTAIGESDRMTLVFRKPD